MPWRPHGHFNVNAAAPTARGICDRCGFAYQLSELSWQFQWAGPRLQNIRLLVCKGCLDIPNPQLKPRILPPDPVPRMNARPENLVYERESYLATQDGDQIVTQDGLNIITQPTLDIPDDIA